MRAQEFLSELLDPKLAQPVEWQDSETAVSKLPNGKTIIVNLRKRRGVVTVEFSVDGQYQITGRGDANQVFVTVIQVVKEFVENNPEVHTFTFTANEYSRARLYDALTKRVSAQLGWHVVPFDELMSAPEYEDIRTIGGYLFVIEKGAAPEHRQSFQKPQHGKFKNIWYVSSMDDKELPQYKVTGGKKAWHAMKYVIDNIAEYKQLNPQVITAKHHPQPGQEIIDLGEYTPS